MNLSLKCLNQIELSKGFFLNKQLLLLKFIDQLTIDLQTAKAAADSTKDAATNEESKPENQYDTRALEASYLAGAQAHRVREIEAQILVFRQTEILQYNSTTPIGPTALIQIKSEKLESTVFMMSQAGGLTVQFDNKRIQVITPGSPLGEALVGLCQGEIAQVENPKKTTHFQILTVE